MNVLTEHERAALNAEIDALCERHASRIATLITSVSFVSSLVGGITAAFLMRMLGVLALSLLVGCSGRQTAEVELDEQGRVTAIRYQHEEVPVAKPYTAEMPDTVDATIRNHIGAALSSLASGDFEGARQSFILAARRAGALRGASRNAVAGVLANAAAAEKDAE